VTYILLFIIGFVSWFGGTLAAGGAGMIFLVLAGFVLPIEAVPVVLGFTGMVAGSYRTWIYRHDVDYKILAWLLPGTIVGALIGAKILAVLVTEDAARTLEIFMGVFLLVSGAIALSKWKPLDVPAKLWLFLPFGFVTSVLSGIIGAGSPAINMLFRKFPMPPVRMVGTKSLNLFALQLSKSIMYAFFMSSAGNGVWDDIVKQNLLALCAFASIGAILGSYVSKKMLHKLKDEHFDTALNIMLILAGLKMLYPF
jgi:uncharacterized protein